MSIISLNVVSRVLPFPGSSDLSVGTRALQLPISGHLPQFGQCLGCGFHARVFPSVGFYLLLGPTSEIISETSFSSSGSLFGGFHIRVCLHAQGFPQVRGHVHGSCVEADVSPAARALRGSPPVGTFAVAHGPCSAAASQAGGVRRRGRSVLCPPCLRLVSSYRDLGVRSCPEAGPEDPLGAVQARPLPLLPHALAVTWHLFFLRAPSCCGAGGGGQTRE